MTQTRLSRAARFLLACALTVLLLCLMGILLANADHSAAAVFAVGERNPGSSTRLTGSARETLVVNLGSYPNVIDPQLSSFVNELAILNLIYEGLTRLDSQLQTVPGAADSWYYNSAGTELTFTLRAGLKYSDGTILNAERFRYSILRNIDPATRGGYAQSTDEIVGAAEWRSGTGAREGVAVYARDMSGQPCTGYDQPDCRILAMHLRHPAPYFHTVLSLWVTYPAKQEYIEAGGPNWWQSSEYQIGNGPFVLRELVPQGRAHFVPNSEYWRGTASYDLEFRFISDSSIAFAEYKLNHLDLIGASAADMAEIKASPVLSRELMVYNGSCTYAVMFHNLKPPFTDPKVRAAFAYAFDREAWVRDILGGAGLPTLTWIPRGYPGYDAAESRWAYNPLSATLSLAESSYGGVGSLPPITATFSSSPRNQARFQWLVNEWHDVLGVDIPLNPVDPTTYVSLTKDINTAPQLYILGWCADYPDPQNWLSVYWKTGAFGQRIGYSNPALDALLTAADSAIDPVERLALYFEAQRMLIGDVPVAMAWNNRNAFLVKSRVKGILTTPQDSDWAGSRDPLSITVEPWQRIYLPLLQR